MISSTKYKTAGVFEQREFIENLVQTNKCKFNTKCNPRGPRLRHKLDKSILNPY